MPPIHAALLATPEHRGAGQQPRQLRHGERDPLISTLTLQVPTIWGPRSRYIVGPWAVRASYRPLSVQGFRIFVWESLESLTKKGFSSKDEPETLIEPRRKPLAYTLLQNPSRT